MPVISDQKTSINTDDPHAPAHSDLQEMMLFFIPSAVMRGSWLAPMRPALFPVNLGSNLSPVVGFVAVDYMSEDASEGNERGVLFRNSQRKSTTM